MFPYYLFILPYPVWPSSSEGLVLRIGKGIKGDRYKVLHCREGLADSVLATGSGGKPRWSAQFRQSTIP